MKYSLIATVLIVPNLYFLVWTLYHTYRAKRQLKGSILASLLMVNLMVLVNIIYGI